MSIYLSVCGLMGRLEQSRNKTALFEFYFGFIAQRSIFQDGHVFAVGDWLERYRVQGASKK